MKLYNYKGVLLTRDESFDAKCLGCYFLDEETAGCNAPAPTKTFPDCMTVRAGCRTDFQFHEYPIYDDEESNDIKSEYIYYK